MANTFPTVEQIAAKHANGETLTAWETSVYRLNFRDDGSRYSADPVERDKQYGEDNAKTAADRFQRAAKRVRESHGGRPTASLNAEGRFVFTYPDGAVRVS